jgi:hypothetical protein
MATADERLEDGLQPRRRLRGDPASAPLPTALRGFTGRPTGRWAPRRTNCTTEENR